MDDPNIAQAILAALQNMQENLVRGFNGLQESQNKANETILSAVRELAASRSRSSSPREQTFRNAADSEVRTPLNRRLTNVFMGATGVPGNRQPPGAAEDISPTAAAVPRSQHMYIQPIPDLDKYMLTELSIAAYQRFVEGHERFKRIYGDNARPFSEFFNPYVIRQLVNQPEAPGVHFELFPTYTEDEIKNLIRLRLQARDDLELKKSLKSLSYPKKESYDPANGYRFDVLKYRSFLNHYKIFEKDFNFLLDFHLHNNVKVSPPKMEHKDRNPMKIFTEALPCPPYIKSVYEEITKVESKFKNMEDFLERLNQEFTKHNTISEAALRVQRMSQDFKEIDEKAPSKFGQKPDLRPQRQHALRYDSEPDPDDLFHSDMLARQKTLESDSMDFDEELHFLQKSDSQRKQFGKTSYAPKEKSSLPCKQFCEDRTCKYGDGCKYSHDPKVCAEYFRTKDENPSRFLRSNDPYVPVPKPVRQSLTNLEPVAVDDDVFLDPDDDN